MSPALPPAPPRPTPPHPTPPTHPPLEPHCRCPTQTFTRTGPVQTSWCGGLHLGLGRTSSPVEHVFCTDVQASGALKKLWGVVAVERPGAAGGAQSQDKWTKQLCCDARQEGGRARSKHLVPQCGGLQAALNRQQGPAAGAVNCSNTWSMAGGKCPAHPECFCNQQRPSTGSRGAEVLHTVGCDTVPPQVPIAATMPQVRLGPAETCMAWLKTT
jgi:hypothetical protein